MENRFKKFSSGDEPGRGVDHEKNEDENRRDDSEKVTVVLETVLEKIRQRQGIICQFGIIPETAGDELPVEESTDSQTQADPSGVETGNISVARQAHKHPTAHVRGFRA